MTTAGEVQPGALQAQRLERACEQLVALLQQQQDAQRLRAASEGDWSAMQVIGHVVEMIPHWLRQCQLLIDAQGAPPPFGRTADDEGRLAGVARGAAEDPAALIRALESAVKDAADTIRGLSESARRAVGVHSRLGEMTVQQIIEVLIVAHAEEHLAQVRAASQ
jgi:uncharacterized damage-inducible protein DinB